jgi:hypothetical protein
MVMLKRDFCQTLVRPSSSRTLPENLQHSDVGIGVNVSLLGIISTSIIPSQFQKIVIMILPTDADYLIFSTTEMKDRAIPGCLSVSTAR